MLQNGKITKMFFFNVHLLKKGETKWRGQNKSYLTDHILFCKFDFGTMYIFYILSQQNEVIS